MHRKLQADRTFSLVQVVKALEAFLHLPLLALVTRLLHLQGHLVFAVYSGKFIISKSLQQVGLRRLVFQHNEVLAPLFRNLQ